MRRAAAVMGLFAILSGCQKPSVINNNAIEIEKLKSKMVIAQTEINILRKRLNELSRPDETTLLKRGDSGWSVIKSDIGGMTAEIKNISDSGGSAQIKMRIGNASSATILKTQIFALWGGVDKDGEPAGESHSITPTIEKTIDPGSWEDVTFPINGAKAADVGYIRVFSASASSIRMNVPD